MAKIRIEVGNVLVFFILLLLSSNLISAVEPPPPTDDPLNKPYAVSAPNLDYPELNAPGSFGTSLFTGATTYNYEIEVPPGTNGLKPSLFVYYNNQDLKDRPYVLGNGWRLSQSYIQRDVNYTPSSIYDDKFELVLNGKKYDLIFIPTENRYHTKIESFLYIKNESGGNNKNNDYWIIKTKEGTSYRFGYNLDSEAVSIDYSYTLRWYLDLVKDIHNNSIFYSYQEDYSPNDIGATYPYRIEYNNNKSRKVEFSWEAVDRPDIITLYKQGSMIRQTRRLKSIDVSANNQLVRGYFFNYTLFDSSPNSLLSAITIFGSDGISTLPSVKFEYERLDSSWSIGSWIPPISFAEGIDGTDRGVRLVDLNGDGLIDILQSYEPLLNGNDKIRLAYLNTGGGWQIASQWTPPVTFSKGEYGYDRGVRFIDLNGDGLPDILQDWDSSWDSVNEVKSAYLNTGNGWQLVSQWIPPVTFSKGKHGYDRGVRLVDVNGDGLTDIIKNWDRSWSGNDYKKEAYLNTGNGWVLATQWTPPLPFSKGDFGYDRGVRLVDLNGDGLIDILQSYEPLLNGNDKIRLAYLNTGGGWQIASQWTPPVTFSKGELSYDKGVHFGDLNGDGLADLIQSYKYGSNYEKINYINKAAKGYLLVKLTNSFGGTISIDYKGSTILNNTGGDGISDLGFNLWVVDSITKNNGLSGSHQVISTTNYDYSGGLYDSYNHEFSGFKYATETLPDSSIVKHQFNQDKGRRGTESETKILNASGNIFERTEYSWKSEVKPGGYYIVYLDKMLDYTFDGN